MHFLASQKERVSDAIIWIFCMRSDLFPMGLCINNTPLLFFICHFKTQKSAALDIWWGDKKVTCGGEVQTLLSIAFKCCSTRTADGMVTLTLMGVKQGLVKLH